MTTLDIEQQITDLHKHPVMKHNRWCASVYFYWLASGLRKAEIYVHAGREFRRIFRISCEGSTIDEAIVKVFNSATAKLDTVKETAEG